MRTLSAALSAMVGPLVLAATCYPFTSATAADADVPAPINPMTVSRPLRPGSPRYLENYAFLADVSRRTDFFDPLRYIPVARSSYLSLGGGVRYRYEDLDQPDFGLQGVHDDDYWQQRIQLHADLHLFDDALRGFLQLENTESWGKAVYSPFDESDNEVHQAFVDVRLPAGTGRSLIARLGRQEMAFGDLALIDVRDVPNVRLSFDGARLSYRNENGYKVDAFAVRPIDNVRDGSFNDSSTGSGDFYGIYATLPLTEAINEDLYALSYRRDHRTLGGVTGKDHRHTLGTRFFGGRQGVDFSLNMMYQFGELADQDIRAWALLGTTGYTLTQRPGKPRLGLLVSAASGDDNPGDHDSNTFDPLFSGSGKFFGSADLAALSNLITIGPQFSFSLSPAVTISPAVLSMWRESEDDAAYVPGIYAIPGTADVSGKRLGTTYNLFTRWTPTANLTVDIEYQYYDVDDVIHDAGGKNTQYISVRTSFLF